MTLQVVLLAGGLGTRMRPLTVTMPKALIPVLGRPFADWQLTQLAAQGVKRVTCCVGYRGDMLRDHVGDGSRFGLSVSWVDEGSRLRGTGGALDDAFFVLWGDSYLPVVFSSVEDAWRSSSLPALMTVMRNEGRWAASNAIYSDGRITLYDKSRPEERRSEMQWIDYGLSVLTRDVVDLHIASDSIADLAGVMRDLSLAGQLAGLEVTQRFYEVGSPEGTRDLEDFLSKSRPPGSDGG